MNSGQAVRTLVELVASDGVVVNAGTPGFVIGFEGNRLIVQVEDRDTGVSRTVTVEPWEVRRR